jgi:hypothetical protein
MATLLACSTFNCVRVWGGPSNLITNTIVGCFAGQSISSTGGDNTIFGYKAGCDFQDQYGNSVMGAYAMSSGNGATPGNVKFNVAFGACSMKNVDANVCYNTAIGTSTLQCGNPQFNVAIGHQSMFNGSMNGDKNTFVGYQAGCGGSQIGGSCNIGIGGKSLQSINNGSCNIGVGYKALNSLTNGNGNVAVGTCSGANINNANDTIAIGYGATTSDFGGHTVAGNSSMTCFIVSSAWTNLSDGRDKTDIEPLNDNLGLNFIRNLRPVKFNFDYRDNYVKKCGFEFGVKDGTLKQDIESYGFIAQEIESTLNNIGTHFDSVSKNELGNYGMEYEHLISPIVKSLQQTIQRLEILESKV